MKKFTYRFSDGHEMEMESTNAAMDIMRQYEQENDCKMIFNGFFDQVSSLQLLRANSHTRGDGFKPGFHPGLGMEIRTNGQYQEVLKEKGMVEVGNSVQTTPKQKKRAQFTEEIIKDAVAMGAEISGNEASKLLGETT